MIEIFFLITLVIFFTLSLLAIARAVLQGSSIKEALGGVRQKTEDLEQQTQAVHQDLQKLEFDLELSDTERRSIQHQQECMKKLAESQARRAGGQGREQSR